MFDRLQRSILFPREYAAPDPRPGEGVAGLERIWIESPQGPIESWFMPVGTRAPAVMFAHGNAELIDYWPVSLERYRRLGVSVWLGEYRGYGRSAGEPTQERITADFVAMYDLLAARYDVDADRIFFHGRSLGGGVVAQLAAHRAPAAMVLESTFTSVVDMAKQFMMPGALVADPFDTRAVLRELRVPTLLFHGRHDSVVPYSHALALCEVASGSRLVTYDADHNDFPPDRDAYWSEIETFLIEHGFV